MSEYEAMRAEIRRLHAVCREKNRETADLLAALRRIAKEPDNVEEWLNADQMQAIARAALARVKGGE